MIQIYGHLVDKESRCQHYHSQLDVVGLKCFECRKYYACYRCHDDLEQHLFSAYPLHQNEDKVVICGVCRSEMTFSEYRASMFCPSCQATFNPGCEKHYSIYFKQ